MKIILLFFMLAIMLTNCSMDGGGEQRLNNYNFSRDYWGEWIRLDTGQAWYINDRDVIYNDVPYPNRISLRRENNEVIEVTEGSRRFYIYASRVKNASFSGRVVDGSSSSVITGSEQGVGSIAVVISNLLNASDQTLVWTDEDGNFFVENIIPWDTYEVTIGGKTWTVTPADGDDVGIMTLRDGVNLKAYLTVEDADRIFADRDGFDSGHQFSIFIENVGDRNPSRTSFASYSLESSGMHFNEVGIDRVMPDHLVPIDDLGPGRRMRIRFNLSFDPITVEQELKQISFTITDPAEGVTWREFATIRVNTPVRVNIEAQSPVHGVIVAPYKKAYNIRAGREIILPWATEDYIMVLFSRLQSTPYSLGIDLTPSTQWALLADQDVYKPQNTEATAAPIGMSEQRMAYIFENTVDYWRINMSNLFPGQ